MRSSVGRRRPAADDQDVRLVALRAAVARLRRRLAVLPADFPDRAIAEEALADLAAMTAHGVPELARLRRSLLLVAGSIGSVSALFPYLAEVRDAVDLFGGPPGR